MKILKRFVAKASIAVKTGDGLWVAMKPRMTNFRGLLPFSLLKVSISVPVSWSVADLLSLLLIASAINIIDM